MCSTVLPLSGQQTMGSVTGTYATVSKQAIEVPICTEEGDQWDPKINRYIAIWKETCADDNYDGYLYNIYLYDISTSIGTPHLYY